MRYMWIVNPEVSANRVMDWLKAAHRHYADRVIHTQQRCAWVFITSWDTYENALHREYVDVGHLWGITSCNKQYVNNENTGKFVGCLAQCTRQAGINNAKLNDSFYVVDVDSSRIWTPVLQNPNRLIPTRDEKRDTWPEQKRPWPLEGPTYEQWKSDVIDAVNEALAKAL